MLWKNYVSDYLKADEYEELMNRRRHRCQRCGRIDGLCYKDGDKWRTNHLHVVYLNGDNKNHADSNLLVLCSTCYANLLHKLLQENIAPVERQTARQLSLFD